MNCCHCGRSVRDENAVIDSRVIRERDRNGLMIGSHVETKIYGRTCAKNLGIAVPKLVREKKPRKVRTCRVRVAKVDTDTADLFEGMQ